MVPRYMRLVNVSNNLANSTTEGYKADRRYFSTLLNNEIVQPGIGGRPKRMEDLEKGLFTEFDQGALRDTRDRMNFALNGPGFFVLEDPDTEEVYYTRNGRFRLNLNQELVNSLGYNVLDDGGAPIVVNGNQFAVTNDGEIFVDGQDRGSFGVVVFDNPNDLQKKGHSLYMNPENKHPDIAEETYVMQGFLESSNVNIVEEMVIMIELNRNYESSQRALVSQDHSLEKAVNQVSRY